MSLQPVTCPSCRAEVHVELARVGTMPVMAECPVCGEGPAVVDVSGDGGELASPGDVVFLHLAAPSVARLAEVMRLIDDDYEALDDEAAAARVREELTEEGHLLVPFPRAHVEPFTADLANEFPDVRIVGQSDVPAELLAAAMEPEDPSVGVAPGHAATNAAIARARADLGRFLARLAAPRAGDAHFAVKAPLRDRGRTEHVWLADVRVEGDAFVGTIANEPEEVSVAALGDEWRVPRAEISDWAFENGERMHGHYTLRAMLPYLPDEARTELEGRLAPLD